MSPGWYVKVKRYDGGTSIIGRYTDREEAGRFASFKNAEYQSNNYYAEAIKD